MAAKSAGPLAWLSLLEQVKQVAQKQDSATKRSTTVQLY
jgi:hypothetical protein